MSYFTEKLLEKFESFKDDDTIDDDELILLIPGFFYVFIHFYEQREEFKLSNVMKINKKCKEVMFKDIYRHDDIDTESEDFNFFRTTRNCFAHHSFEINLTNETVVWEPEHKNYTKRPAHIKPRRLCYYTVKNFQDRGGQEDIRKYYYIKMDNFINNFIYPVLHIIKREENIDKTDDNNNN
eukprot:TRINITY_DN9352_c0_g1_i1.p1 TRINITY_DN9352_c0_g1~~TRINITY_DN9352_c0_g1_i1.p1  ORF type:complete len:181 (+),score=36.88 TRINITY_DN9352_c0_g1_i1:52-594(+)